VVLVSRYYIFNYLSYFINIFGYKNNEIGSILKMEKFGLFWRRSKNFYKSGSVSVNGVIETRRGRKLNKGDKVIFLKNELFFD